MQLLPHRPQPCITAGTGSMDLTASKVHQCFKTVNEKENGGLLDRRLSSHISFELVALFGALKPSPRVGLDRFRIRYRTLLVGLRIVARLRLLLLDRMRWFIAVTHETAAIFCRHCRVPFLLRSQAKRAGAVRLKKSKRALALFARRVLDPSLCRSFSAETRSNEKPLRRGAFLSFVLKLDSRPAPVGKEKEEAEGLG